MTSRYKNKDGWNKVQLITYLTPEIKEQFKIKCKNKGTTPSTQLRQYVLGFLNRN